MVDFTDSFSGIDLTIMKTEHVFRHKSVMSAKAFERWVREYASYIEVVDETGKYEFEIVNVYPSDGPAYLEELHFKRIR